MSGEKLFLKNHLQNVLDNLFPDPFQKIKIEHISRSVVNSFIQFVFIIWQVQGYRNIFKSSCRLVAFTSYKDFLKNKKRSETCLPATFLAWFMKKDSSLNWPNFVAIRLWRHKFWNTLSLWLSRFFYVTKKSRQKFEIPWKKYLENERSF